MSTPLIDHAGHSTLVRVEKWAPDQVRHVRRTLDLPAACDPTLAQLRAVLAPAEVVEDDTPNLTTTGGLGRLTSFLVGTAGLVGFSAATTTAVAVGSSSTAAAPADTDMGTPLYYNPADSTPTRTATTVANDTIQVVSTFGSAVANGVWAEWGLVLVTGATASTTLAGTGTSPLLFNHKIAALGTKASGSTWAFTAKLTWS
jgi:hypothetical protein